MRGKNLAALVAIVQYLHIVLGKETYLKSQNLSGLPIVQPYRQPKKHAIPTVVQVFARVVVGKRDAVRDDIEHVGCIHGCMHALRDKVNPLLPRLRRQ